MKLFSSLLAGAAALTLSLTALAGETPFNQARFDQDVAAGKPVVVDFAADWCPTCRAQKPLIGAILQQPEMAGVTVYVANFDTESALKKALRVSGQSTLVVFKGGKEVARSTGQTQKAQLQALLAKAL
jgi:thiol-disulfide isomerase/thioredoxin